MSVRGLEATEALISLLNILEKNDREQCIRSLGGSTGISKSTVHRMLQNLASKFWVYQDSESKNYYIGVRFLCLADEWRRNLKIIKFAESDLQELVRKCNQTITINVLHKEKALCIHKIDALNILRIASRVGHEYPLYAGASGKTILSCSSKQLIEKILSGELISYTPFTVTDPEVLRNQLNEIYANRYCVTREEIDAGIGAIASPVFNKNGKLAFVVTLAGAHFEINKHEEEYKEMLLETVKKLELKICSYGL